MTCHECKSGHCDVSHHTGAGWEPRRPMSRGVGGGFPRVRHAQHRCYWTEKWTHAQNNRQDTVQPSCAPTTDNRQQTTDTQTHKHTDTQTHRHTDTQTQGQHTTDNRQQTAQTPPFPALSVCCSPVCALSRCCRCSRAYTSTACHVHTTHMRKYIGNHIKPLPTLCPGSADRGAHVRPNLARLRRRRFWPEHGRLPWFACTQGTWGTVAWDTQWRAVTSTSAHRGVGTLGQRHALVRATTASIFSATAEVAITVAITVAAAAAAAAAVAAAAAAAVVAAVALAAVAIW